jgi:signal peptide peptidase SppA
MSRHTALLASTAFQNQPSYIEESYGRTDAKGVSFVAEALAQLAAADPIAEMASWAERRAALPATVGLIGDSAAADKPFAFANGVAVIPVYGLLINRFPYCWGFVTGYTFVQQQFRQAMADPDVTLITFDFNSGGGSVNGCEELSAEIFAGRDIKPSVALVDGVCYSAAYYLASSASQVWATPTSGVGSIGAYAVRTDMTGALAQMGIKATVVFAGANKLDGNPLVPFSDAAQVRWQASIDESYNMFVAAVARNRADLDTEAVQATKASCYGAADALSAKLIDGIGTPEYALEQAGAALVTSEDDDELPPDEEDDTMALNAEQQAAADAAGKSAIAAERARVNGILSCDEARDKGKLAQTLAAQDITVEVAKSILSAAASEKAPEAAAPGSVLDQQMQQQEKPEVKSDAALHNGKQLSAAGRIALAQDRGDGTDNFAKLEKRGRAYVN